MALDDAVTELEPLAFLLGRLLDQLCARLEARSLAASAFCLRFDLQDSAEEELLGLSWRDHEAGVEGDFSQVAASPGH